MKIFRFSTLLVMFIAVACATLVAGCNEDLLDDATFRLWCGDSLCAWKLDAGHIRQAPTWHKDDYGVEFLDTPTVISQDLKKAARCLVFTTIADVAASAQVTVGIDFTGDGVVDYQQPIAATGFREVTTQVTAPKTDEIPRIFISKKGSGHAVLAQMRLQSGDNCSAPALRLHDSPLGAACTQGSPSECSSGVCCEGRCADCCVDPLRQDVTDDGGVTMAPEAQCPDAGKCESRVLDSVPVNDGTGAIYTGVYTPLPLQCDPGLRQRPSGADCLADDDCSSDECVGASSQAVVPSATFIWDRTGAPCPNAHFPDAGGQGCVFTQVHQGHCR